MWEVFVVTMLFLLGVLALVGFIFSISAFRRVGRLEALVGNKDETPKRVKTKPMAREEIETRSEIRQGIDGIGLADIRGEV